MRTNLTTCIMSAHKPSTSSFRTDCAKWSTSLEQIVAKLQKIAGNIKDFLEVCNSDTVALSQVCPKVDNTSSIVISLLHHDQFCSRNLGNESESLINIVTGC